MVFLAKKLTFFDLSAHIFLHSFKDNSYFAKRESKMLYDKRRVQSALKR